MAKRENNHRVKWIRWLSSKGLAPVLEILAEASEAEWPALECAFIQFFREEGNSLTNATDGGEGVTMTPETRAKIGFANSGNKSVLFGKTPWNLGLATPEEVCEKNRLAHLGKKASLETRAKMRVAQALRWKRYHEKKNEKTQDSQILT